MARDAKENRWLQTKIKSNDLKRLNRITFCDGSKCCRIKRKVLTTTTTTNWDQWHDDICCEALTGLCVYVCVCVFEVFSFFDQSIFCIWTTFFSSLAFGIHKETIHTLCARMKHTPPTYIDLFTHFMHTDTHTQFIGFHSLDSMLLSVDCT